jgi:hypothetical protein
MIYLSADIECGVDDIYPSSTLHIVLVEVKPVHDI